MIARNTRCTGVYTEFLIMIHTEPLSYLFVFHIPIGGIPIFFIS
nr:MAG TPA: hypothetical protein [Caudoviricetes sp.]